MGCPAARLRPPGGLQAAPLDPANQAVESQRQSDLDWITLNLLHELNQPLAAIVLYVQGCQGILADVPGRTDDRLAVALDHAMTQALHAGRIVSGLRAFVMHGRSERRPEGVADLVRAAAALARPKLEQHAVRLTLAFDPMLPLVLVDRLQVEQVLLNLIHNALHAMQDSPRRVLSIAARRGPGGTVDSRTVEISVADSGTGLPEAVRERLGEPFVTTRMNGTGLGLTICRAIVEAHGGRLSHRAPRDGGCIFRFTLPAAPDAAAC
jgi:two-component system sensor kinase FixL